MRTWWVGPLVGCLTLGCGESPDHAPMRVAPHDGGDSDSDAGPTMGDGDGDQAEPSDHPGDAGLSDAGDGAPAEDPKAFHDPGSGPWEVVPEAEVFARCKLDIGILKSLELGAGFAVSRYGLLCHNSVGQDDGLSPMWSGTKTLGALVTGIASYETRNIARTGPQTGQLLDTDRADHWLTGFSYEKEAHIAHVLAMVGHTPNFDTFDYDGLGITQINTLSSVVSTAIAQDAARLGTDTGSFAQKFLFDAIGMADSTWSGEIFAFSWDATLRDMLRVGLLILHRGMWSGTRILDESWTYKMTHPAFEHASTSYGYLTWLNAREGAAGVGGAGGSGGAAGDACAPPSVWPRASYPHGLSDAQDCTYTTSKAQCQQKYDVGVWSAQGLGGQFIVGHPGLDLVIAVKDYGDDKGHAQVWQAIRPALVALDPTFAGDEAAFCAAYAAGDYAPDLVGTVVAPSP